MCYVCVSATSAAGVLTSNPGLDPVAFIPSGRRHRGGLHWRANDGWRIIKRREAVGAVLLALALLGRLDRKVSKLAQLERTGACDVLETFVITALTVTCLVPGAAAVVFLAAWMITNTNISSTV